MTLEEKLINFKTCAIKDANMQSDSIISNHQENIKNKLEEYELKSKEEYNNKLQIQSSIIISKNNQDISKDSLVIKQKIENKRMELVDKLFYDLEKKIRDYKKTKDYNILLEKQICAAKEYSEDANIIIYIDESDIKLLDDLKIKTNVEIEVSNSDMIGGIKAVMKDKNILLDYSFANKLRDEKNNFSF